MAASRIKAFVRQKTQEAAGIMSKNRSAVARSKSIDHQLDEERERKQKEIQLLILGGASSGKSTFIKQLRIHQGDGIPATERVKFCPDIYENLTDALNIVLDNMAAVVTNDGGNNMPNCFEKDANRAFSVELQKMFPRWRHHYIQSCNMPHSPQRTKKSCDCHPSPPDFSRLMAYLEKVHALWLDAGIQRCYRQHSQFSLLVPAEEYFLDNLPRIAQENYVPSLKDVLYIRKATMGVQEHSFVSNGLQYRVIDVAGQINQRMKWIHFFESVTAVLFFASLSGFCENLEEDESINSLHDSLQTFSDVIHNSFLVNTDFLLFLNKRDIFERRLQTTALSGCFPQYSDDRDVDKAIKFIESEFRARKPSEKHMYTHVSCAIDTGLMRTIIADVMQIVVEINLRKANMPL